MYEMPIENCDEVIDALAQSTRNVKVLWEQPGSLVFIAKGREYRSEFHINPGDEVMIMLRGEMKLHYRTPEGLEKVAVIPEGSTIHTPAGIPHSPRFGRDAYAMILERGRKPDEDDRFQWFCPQCDTLLHEEVFHVTGYHKDPVAKAYHNFYDVEAHRSCRSCGHVVPNAFA